MICLETKLNRKYFQFELVRTGALPENNKTSVIGQKVLANSTRIEYVSLERSVQWAIFIAKKPILPCKDALVVKSQQLSPEEQEKLNLEFFKYCDENSFYAFQFSHERYIGYLEQGAQREILKGLPTEKSNRVILFLIKHKMIKEAILLIDLTGHLPNWISFLGVISLLAHGSEKTCTLIGEQNEDPLIPYAHYFQSSAYEGYKEFVGKGYSITASMLWKCVQLKNYRFLNFIFSKLSEESLKSFSEDIFAFLILSEDATLNKLVSDALKSKNVFDYANSLSEKLLTQTVMKGCKEFVRWALDNGKKIGSCKKLLEIALTTYNIPLIKHLFNHGKTTGELKQENYLEILGFGESTKKDADLLFKYLAFSPLSEILKLVHAFPYLASSLQEVLPLTAFFVRFPLHLGFIVSDGLHSSSSFNYLELGKDENDFTLTSKMIENFLFSTLQYAQKNLLTARKIAEFLPKLNHAQLLKEIVNARESDFGLINQSYKQVKDSSHTRNVETALIKTTHGHTRYWHSLKHFSIIAFGLQEAVSITAKYPALLDVKEYRHEKIVDFYYTKKDKIIGTVNTLVISSLNSYPSQSQSPLKYLYWKHPLGDEISKFANELEELHQQLLDKDLPKRDRRLFDETMARYYYLIATLSEYKRGTPHNAMMVLNIFYIYHRLNPPIPTLEHFFLDNTALNVPLTRFIEMWPTFFEKTP